MREASLLAGDAKHPEVWPYYGDHSELVTMSYTHHLSRA